MNSVRLALSRVSEWSRGPLVLLPDSTAALFALDANPGVPGSGIIAVCDFGGSGTTLSLVDAANGYQAITQAVRHTEFSGSRIDQALLTHVIGDLSTAGSFDTAATSAIGSLSQLRTACRYAKERLSSANETELTAEVPGYHGEIRLTRSELDDAIRQPLDSFVGFFHDVLQRNGIRPGNLAAVASVGGGASIPFVTRTLSEQSGALVISAPRPHLTAAVGAALQAARGSGDGDTALAPTALGSVSEATIMALCQSNRQPLRHWPGRKPTTTPASCRSAPASTTTNLATTGRGAPPASAGRTCAEPDVIGATGDPWYRRPLVVAIGTALAVLAIAAALILHAAAHLRQRAQQPVAEREYDARAIAAHVGRNHRKPGDVHKPAVVGPARHEHARVDNQRNADDNDHDERATTTTTTATSTQASYDHRQTGPPPFRRQPDGRPRSRGGPRRWLPPLSSWCWSSWLVVLLLVVWLFVLAELRIAVVVKPFVDSRRR